MEYGAVMPEREAVLGELHLGNIRLQPMYGAGVVSQPATRHIERGGRNIEHGQVAVLRCQQVVNQGRSTAADIDDRSIRSDTCLTNQREGAVCMWLVPAHRVGCLVGVHGLPLGLVLHRLSSLPGVPVGSVLTCRTAG